MSDDNERGTNPQLPDISGVFQINEEDIPDEALEPTAVGTGAESREPIMLFDEKKQKAQKAEQNKKTTLKKQQKKKKQTKKIKRNLILIVIGIVLLAGLTAAIKCYAEYRRLPEVSVQNSQVGDLIKRYDTAAMLKNMQAENGGSQSYALFIENDYDIYGLTKGLYTEVLLDNGLSATGEVEAVRQISPDDSLFGDIVLSLPEEEYSASVNFLVTVRLNADLNLTQTETARLAIQTKKAVGAVLVPESAVFRDGLSYFVYTVDSGKLNKTEVSVGITQNGAVEITSGLSADTGVVTDLDQEDELPQSGTKVRIKTQKEKDTQ